MTLMTNKQNFELTNPSSKFSLKNANLDKLANRHFVLESVQNNGLNLEHSGHFRDDAEIAFAAFCQNPDAAKFIGNGLRNDRDFMLKLIRMDALTVRYLGDSLRQDKELILTAIKGDKAAIRFVDLDTVCEMLLELST